MNELADGLRGFLTEVVKGNYVWYAAAALLWCDIATGALRGLLRDE